MNEADETVIALGFGPQGARLSIDRMPRSRPPWWRRRVPYESPFEAAREAERQRQVNLLRRGETG